MLLTHSRVLIKADRLTALVTGRNVWFGAIIIGLGLLLGPLFATSVAMAELLISMVVLAALLLLTINRPLHGLLVWLFFMAFLETWIEIPMGAGLPDLSFSRFAVLFLILSLLARAATGAWRFRPVSWADICMVGTAIGIGLSAPLSGNPVNMLQEVLTRYAVPLSGYFFAKNLVRNRQDLGQLLRVVALFGFVAGSYTIYEAMTGNILFVPKGSEEFSRFFRPEADIRIIWGLMGRSGTMGRLLDVTILVTAHLFLQHSRRHVGKILFGVMLAVQLYGLFLTMSRAPWLALLIAIVVMQFFYPGLRRWLITWVAVAAMVLGVTWTQIPQSAVAARISHRLETFNGRTSRWRAGFEMWKARPIRGWGQGAFDVHSGLFRTDGIQKPLRAIENDYLNLLVENGLLGFLPYLLFIFLPLLNSVRLFLKSRDPDWPGFITPETLVMYWGVILCLLTASFAAVNSHPVNRLFPFVLAGAIVGSHEHIRCGSKGA